jgi:hypothetical protein
MKLKYHLKYKLKYKLSLLEIIMAIIILCMATIFLAPEYITSCKKINTIIHFISKTKISSSQNTTGITEILENFNNTTKLKHYPNEYFSKK